MSAEGHQHGPAVIFVDDDQWECFFHLAAVLRKSGVRTVRVSVGHSGWQVENVVFDRQVSLAHVPTPQELADILSNEYVSDVQVTESLAETTYAALGLLPDSQCSNLWLGRSDLLDKLATAQALRDVGLRAPDTLPVTDASTLEAASAFSLPIVVKQRVGSSGSGVKVLASLDALQGFVDTIENPERWFYERFVEGVPLVCALVAGEGGVEVLATYEILKRVEPRGPSIVVRFLDDPSIADDAKTLLGIKPVRGMVCFDVIRDSIGVDWVHDVNLRVFGTFSVCQLEGFDFFESYVRCLTDGKRRVSTTQPKVAGVETFTFPSGLEDVFRSGRRGTAPFRTARWIWQYAKLLGARYFLSWTVRTLVSPFRRRPSVAEGS
jgi:hypothetical protein